MSLDFEGYPEHKNYYTDDEWETTHEFQKVYLTVRDDKTDRSLEISRTLRKPIEIMRSKVFDLMPRGKMFSDPSDDFKKLKYMIYSAHDD